MLSQEKSENKYYVYALIDAINSIPFYIGKGVGNRARHHLQPKYKGNGSKHSYIGAIRSLGFEPEIGYIAKNLSEQDAYGIEYWCIRLARQSGLPVTNSHMDEPPSRTGCKMPESAKRAISAFQRSRPSFGPHKVETKRLLSEKLRGRPSYLRTQVVCPHCGKTGANSAMYRWHFDRCKLRDRYQVL